MTAEQAEKIADEIMDLYKRHGGNEYAGKKVTQPEHMAQAARLAEEQGYDEEVILAAFLKDIGYLSESAGTPLSGSPRAVDGYEMMDHEERGAEFLKKRGFSKRIVRLVESQVEATRYLAAKDPAYYAQLPEAHKKSLDHHGGPMTPDEAGAFEQYPLFNVIIQMRKWDEQANIEHKPPSDVERFRQMMLRHLLAIKAVSPKNF